MNIHNITLINARNINKYPFTEDSDLKIDNMVFPYTYISSLIIYSYNVLFPLYLYSMDINIPGKIEINIVDKNLQPVYNILLLQDKNETDIKNNKGIISGHIVYMSLLYKYFIDYIYRLKVSHLQLNPYSFKISGLCISCIYYEGFMGVLINDTVYHRDMCISLLNNIVFNPESNRIDTFGNYDKEYFLASKLRYINGKDMRGCSVFIKPAALGDLRVITLNKDITLKGVLDA